MAHISSTQTLTDWRIKRNTRNTRTTILPLQLIAVGLAGARPLTRNLRITRDLRLNAHTPGQLANRVTAMELLCKLC
jgi:hypothetical protein